MQSEDTASRLKQIMSERNLRQVDILDLANPYCQQLGVKLSKTDLSQYVNGKVKPGQEKLTILGLALNVSETWLMGYDVPEERTGNANNSTYKPIHILSFPYLQLPMTSFPFILSVRSQQDIIVLRLKTSTVKASISHLLISKADQNQTISY